MTNLNVLVNQVNADFSYVAQPTYYIGVSLANDRLLWTKGSSEVFEHCGYNPTDEQLNGAASIILDIPVEVTYCFLNDDTSTEKLHPIFGASSANHRYSFAFRFDGATATEPTLEAWDTSSHLTANLGVLGAGINNDSMVHAICTTSSAPGDKWEGAHLAGSNKVLLNAGLGALTIAKDLYANIYIRIPQNSIAEVSQFVLTIRYTYS